MPYEFDAPFYLSITLVMVYDDVACSMFRFLQNCLNLSETKLPSVSDIIFLSKTFSEKIMLHIGIKLCVDRSSVF